MRHTLTILILAGFAAFATELPVALHLHLWHQDHEEGSDHDHDQCSICQALTTAAHGVIGPGPVLEVEADPWHLVHRPGARAPRLTYVNHLIVPRGPPLPTL